MTKRHALSRRAAPREPDTKPEPPPLRVPSYPDRPVAFRRYPPGWWVTHLALDFCGQVEYSDERGTKIRDGALFHTSALTSCTARQVAALESSPAARSVVAWLP